MGVRDLVEKYLRSTAEFVGVIGAQSSILCESYTVTGGTVQSVADPAVRIRTAMSCTEKARDFLDGKSELLGECVAIASDKKYTRGGELSSEASEAARLIATDPDAAKTIIKDARTVVKMAKYKGGN